MLVGNLEVSIAGHAATVDANPQQGIVLRLKKKSSVVSLRNAVPSIPQWVIRAAVELGIPVSVQLGNWKPVQLLPESSWMARTLYPQLKAVPVVKR